MIDDDVAYQYLIIRSSEMERWSGRVALVTGGSAGIGAAIVRRLAGHGLKVVACGRRVDRIQVNITELAHKRYSYSSYQCRFS